MKCGPQTGWKNLCMICMQTVPRSELTGVLLVVENIRPDALIHFFTDSRITGDTYYKGVHRARLATNADLWVKLVKHIEDENLSLHIFWMPSHTEDDTAKTTKPRLAARLASTI